MSLHGHFDVVGGISGDMSLGAMLDAFPELEGDLRSDLDACGVLPHVTIEVASTKVMGLVVRQAKVSVVPGAPPTHHWHDIRAFIENSACPPAVRDRAIAIFTGLAEAEAVCHGVAVDDVHFHEIADWDSLADIVGVASLIERCGVASWSCGALPLGNGTVMTAHGLLPVPAPATAELLKGYRLTADDELGERITPTGAAILRHLVTDPGAASAGGWLKATGVATGQRRLVKRPNILRLFVTETAEVGVGDLVQRLSFEIDDMTAEELSISLERIRQSEWVLDAGYQVGFGKKGRMRFTVDVLGRADHGEDLVALCFAETSTIGLRVDTCQRRVLTRLPAPEGAKRVRRPGGDTAKVESDRLASVPTLKARRRRVRDVEQDEL